VSFEGYDLLDTSLSCSGSRGPYRDEGSSVCSQTLLFGAFGLLARGLAAVGLYGVMAQTVAQRRHEVGVRMALGARPESIVAMIVFQATTLVVIGLVVGCGMALALTRLMATLLFGVTPADPLTFVGPAIVLLVTPVLASYLPARRTALVDPLVALRCG
jgi:putative ABC transport system permease protein